MHLTSWKSFGMIVILFACIVQRLDCSNRPTKNVSPASCNANVAIDCNLRSSQTFWTISFTTLWKGNLLISISILFANFFISFSALSPLFIFLVLSFCSFSCLDFFSLFVLFILILFTHSSFSFLSFSLLAFISILLTLCAISA